MLRTLKARVAANALGLAQHGVPKAPFYLTGQVGGQPFSVHAEGEHVILTGATGTRREIDLSSPAARTTPEIPSAAPAVDSPTEPATLSPTELPRPICPQGIVAGPSGEGDEPPLPGVSPLDPGLDELEEALRPPKEGGTS